MKLGENEHFELESMETRKGLHFILHPLQAFFFECKFLVVVRSYQQPDQKLAVLTDQTMGALASC